MRNLDYLTLNQSLGIIVALVALIPVPYLYKFYNRSKDFNFLLFAFVFIVGSLVLIADALVSITRSLLVIQIHHIAIDIMFLLLFFHAIRIRWIKTPKLILFIGLIWFITLAILTLSWKIMTQPDQAKVLFWYLPHTFSSYYPFGAGITLSDGTIIYSTAFRYFGEFYRLFVISLLLYSYLKIEIVHPTPIIQRAWKLWIVIWISLLLHTIALFFPSITNLVSVFLLFGGVLAIYIVLKVPEALLISHAEISRALKLLDKSDFESVPKSDEMESYVEYLHETNEILRKKRNSS